MGSSLQFIFFRNPRGKILVKVLLNEKEASLPLREKGPYYKWKRFVKHYRPIISASKKKIEKERIIAGDIPVVSPESRCMDGGVLCAIDSVVKASISGGVIPGAVVSVMRKDAIVFLRAYGNRQVVPDTLEMTESTMFDLASVSKCVGTTLSFMQLVEKGRVALQDRVDKYLPGFQGWKDPDTGRQIPITIEHLLTHSSGLPPEINAYRFVERFGTNRPDSLSSVISKEVPRLFEPGTDYKYSCLNFIALQEILEKVTGERLCDYAQRSVFDALCLKSTCYFNLFGENQSCTQAGNLADRCAATEVQPDGMPLIAAVHDPTARLACAGNSGNAGVFSSARDLSIVSAAILDGGAYGGHRILKKRTVRKMLAVPPEIAPSVARALGWDTYRTRPGIAGDGFDRSRLVGHTGYTGTSMLLDPSTGTAVIILTNRVHPADKGSVKDLRVSIANIVASSIK